MPYLSNPEEFHHETNFHGFYTQVGVKPNWNQSNINPGQEVMNFSIWRFTSPSICEYRPLEEDSSPTKSRPEPKPIIEVKMDFLAFKPDRNEEIWSRNHGDMKDLPKPVKSVLHLPQLEANRSNQLQTKHWRPGDQSRHSGGPSNGLQESEEFVPCTSHHRIRRILIYHNLPYTDAFTLGAITHQRPRHQSYNVLESLPAYLGSSRCTRPHWIRRIPIIPEDQLGLFKLAKPTLFMDCLQPIQFGPTQSYLWKPGDHLNQPEDKEHVLSCTNTQRIRRILLHTNLPYLAASTLNALREILLIFAQDQRPYSLLLRQRSISGRLEDHGHVQKLSRYKGSTRFSFEERKSSKWHIFKAFASKLCYFDLFAFLFLFMTVWSCPESPLSSL